MIMPAAAIKSTATPPLPTQINQLLLNGGSIDRAQLNTVVRRISCSAAR